MIYTGDTYINGHTESDNNFIEEFLALSSHLPELEIILHFAESTCDSGEIIIAGI